MKSLIDDWNSAHESTTKEVEQHNEKILAEVDAGTLPAHSALRGLTPLPKKIEYPGRSWCRHFLRKFGYSLLSSSDNSQAWLPYSHPDMQASREHMRDLIQNKAHQALILNYDQLWRTAFSFGGKLLYKERHLAGPRAAKRKANRVVDKKLHYIKGSRRSLTVSWS